MRKRPPWRIIQRCRVYVFPPRGACFSKGKIGSVSNAVMYPKKLKRSGFLSILFLFKWLYIQWYVVILGPINGLQHSFPYNFSSTTLQAPAGVQYRHWWTSRIFILLLLLWWASWILNILLLNLYASLIFTRFPWMVIVTSFLLLPAPPKNPQLF